jgi:hypothetical protein
VATLNAFGIGTYLFLGGIELKATVFDQIVDHRDFFDIGGGVETYAGFAAARLYDRETALPEPEGGCGDVKQLGHFAYFVEFFIEFVHGVPVKNYLCFFVLQKYKNKANFAH